MGDMDIISGLILALLIQISWALLVSILPVAIWRSLSQQTSGRAAWLHPALALLGPFIAAFVVSALLFLPYYSGQCGGWLGRDLSVRLQPVCDRTNALGYDALRRTWPSRDAAGVAGLIIGLIRRRMTRPAA